MPVDSHILHVSDVHFGTEDHRAIAAFNQYNDEVSPDFIVVAGDLTQRGSRKEFKDAAQWVSQLGAPIIATPGNHDTPLLNLKERATDAFRRYREYLGPEDTELRARHTVLSSINTARGWQARGNWAEGTFNLKRLKHRLDKISKPDRGGFHAMVCHHPLWQPSGATLPIHTRRSRLAIPLIARSPVQAVLCGHVHHASAEQKTSAGGAFVQVTAGTLSTRTRGDLPSFNHIVLSGGTMTITALMIDGGGLEKRGLGRFDCGTQPVNEASR